MDLRFSGFSRIPRWYSWWGIQHHHCSSSVTAVVQDPSLAWEPLHALGTAKKKKKKDFWNPDILMCQCPVLSQARLYSWHWRPSMAESLSSRTLLLWWFSCESLAQISLYPHCRYFSEPLCNLPRGILTLTLFFQLPVAFSFSLSFF